MTLSSVRTKLWTRVEYEAFGAGWTVRAQSPIALDEDSEPEPDIAVVPGTRRDYRGGHPSHPALIVEVADSSLPLDRREKASLYARARIADALWLAARTRARNTAGSRGRPFSRAVRCELFSQYLSHCVQ